jgi:hypothetical protein
MSTALAIQDGDFAPLLDAIDELVEAEAAGQRIERALVEGFVEQGLLSRRAAITVAHRFCAAVLDGARGETDEEIAGRLDCSLDTVGRDRERVQHLASGSKSERLRRQLLGGGQDE